ncbi:hypothetical protein BP5796_00147 [Coleophoma crateriformis]|uniref:Thioesterase domain-containing protein n=1 Tax=Coleophoma crateriformis TaxID=565419 RepID=A0A3D8T798_9HELO|nr:hypothetical protein BP5796_00147 [Coleophoma crateriformis]
MDLAPPAFFTYETPSAEIRTHFSTQPWALALFDDPTLRAFKTLSRLSPGSTFIGETLSTPETIRAWQSFYRMPSAPPLDPNTPRTQKPNTGELFYLLSLGTGVNGHNNTAHGGFVAVVLDEVIGAGCTHHCPRGMTTMTAYMKVDYRKPMMTPTHVLARAWIEDKSAGRKIYGRGVIEDGQGNILAEGEALFLMIDRSKIGLKL